MGWLFEVVVVESCWACFNGVWMHARIVQEVESGREYVDPTDRTAWLVDQPPPPTVWWLGVVCCRYMSVGNVRNKV